MFILTLYNVGTQELVSAQAFNSLKNAQVAMVEQYKREYNDLLSSGYDEEMIEGELAGSSQVGSDSAILGWDYIDEPYKWNIIETEVED